MFVLPGLNAEGNHLSSTAAGGVVVVIFFYYFLVAMRRRVNFYCKRVRILTLENLRGKKG